MNTVVGGGQIILWFVMAVKSGYGNIHSEEWRSAD